jgi:hypothetical protein
MENLQTKRVLLIGGPGDGKMMGVDARMRALRFCEVDAGAVLSPMMTDSPLSVEYHTYGITVIHGTNHEIYCFGQQNMSDCPIEILVAGYRRPKPHPTDANVALQLVTLLGGQADGAQVAASSLQTVVHRGEEYRITPLKGKDGKVFRVGVPLAFDGSVIGALVQGYRK